MFKKDQLNQLALPLILSNVVSLVISLCDQAVMGHLSIYTSDFRRTEVDFKNYITFL